MGMTFHECHFCPPATYLCCMCMICFVFLTSLCNAEVSDARLLVHAHARTHTCSDQAME